MPLEDKDIFAAVCAAYRGQTMEQIMAVYERALTLNAEIEKRFALGVDADVFSAAAPAPEPEMPEPAPEPKPKRVTRRSLKFDPADAIANDRIVCCLCGWEGDVLSKGHLAKHGVTPEEYRRLCRYEADRPLVSGRRLQQMRKNMAKMAAARRAEKGAAQSPAPEEAK